MNESAFGTDLLRVLSFALTLLAFAACSSELDGSSLERRSPSNKNASSESSSDHVDHPKAEGSGSVATPPAAPPAPNDTIPPVANDIFSAAPPFKASVPTESANSHHLGNLRDMSGRPCLNCHGGTPESLYEKLLATDAPKLLFGGTVYRGSDNKPAPGIEIRVVDESAGIEVSAYSDQDGNVWAKSSDNKTLKTATTGRRSSDSKSVMHAAITNGNCNSSGCHASKRIVVP